MGLGDERFQALVQDMGIDLRRRDVGMAQHLLQGPEIGAVGQKMAGEGMDL